MIDYKVSSVTKVQPHPEWRYAHERQVLSGVYLVALMIASSGEILMGSRHRELACRAADDDKGMSIPVGRLLLGLTLFHHGTSVLRATDQVHRSRVNVNFFADASAVQFYVQPLMGLRCTRKLEGLILVNQMWFAHQ